MPQTGDPDRVVYELRNRQGSMTERRQALLRQTRDPRESLLEDPIKILPSRIEEGRFRGALHNRLTTGPPTREGARLTYIWEIMTTPGEVLRQHVGTNAYWRELTTFMDQLLRLLGGQLPPGDYPWNNCRS